MSETIAAISTALGEGGIGIVRVSGPESLNIMKKIMFRFPENVEDRHAYLSKVKNKNNEAIDQAIFIYFKGPKSYTGEDMLEVQAHGSNVSLRNILNIILDCGIDSVRMAEAGEFTKLAFLNGKMDLSQAEAVIDIIKAKTDFSLGIAESQREGRLGNNIREIRNYLLDVLAEMAVNIDYPDEDIDYIAYDELSNKLRYVLNDIEELINTSSIGRIAREGIRVSIIGKPNVGKSSLMNALLGEGRVIVTDIPGTTRDTVEESANLGGIPIVLVDTAGLRDTEDIVEKIGIERTERAIASSDMVMLVIDGSNDLNDEDHKIIDFIKNINSNRVLVVINKSDICSNIDEDNIKSIIPGASIVKTSLVGKNVIESAKIVSTAIGDMFDLVNVKTTETNIITNERHVKMLKDASSNICEAIEMIANGDPIEVAELSARYAYDSLGKIIGEEVGEDIINTVFSKFCLGK